MTNNGSTALAKSADLGSQVEQVLISGDLSRLSAEQRVAYYRAVCESVGLNVLTQPFSYLQLNGKLVLYAGKNCAEQLREIHGVSVESMEDKVINDVYVVTVKVSNKKGRTDMAKGAVNLKGLSGEAFANAVMKAETKAKRRATLSICGLGMLDETEVDSVPGAVRHDPKEQSPQSSQSARHADFGGKEPASSTGKQVGVMRLADEVGTEEVVDNEYTEGVPVYDRDTCEQVGMRPALTSAQNRHIHELLDRLGHHLDEKKGKQVIPRGLYRKKLREKFVKDSTDKLATNEASWVIDWLLRCVAKKEAAIGEQPLLLDGRETAVDE